MAFVGNIWNVIGCIWGYVGMFGVHRVEWKRNRKAPVITRSLVVVLASRSMPGGGCWWSSRTRQQLRATGASRVTQVFGYHFILLREKCPERFLKKGKPISVLANQLRKYIQGSRNGGFCQGREGGVRSKPSEEAQAIRVVDHGEQQKEAPF